MSLQDELNKALERQRALSKDVEVLIERYDRVLKMQEEQLSIMDVLITKMENLDNRMRMLEVDMP